MLESDLSPTQQQNRQLIITTLQQAGWDDNNALFDAGISTDFVASMTYSKGQIAMQLDYVAADETLGLTIGKELFSGIGVQLRMHFGDRLSDVLQAITGFQATINETNMKDCIAQLAQICPDIAQQQGDQFTPISS